LAILGLPAQRRTGFSISGSRRISTENSIDSSIHRNYTLHTPASNTLIPGFDLENGNWTYARLLLEDGKLSLWLNQTGFNFTAGDLLISSENLGDVDLNGNGVFDPFVGYFGLTAGTGGENMQGIVDSLILDVQVVPEPTSIALFGLGLLGLKLRRRRREPRVGA